MGAGFEFKRELLEGVQDQSLDEIMADGLAANNPKFELVDQKKGGAVGAAARGGPGLLRNSPYAARRTG